MKRYLIIQLARFGDLVQTKRLLHSLLSAGDAEVHLCIDGSLEELARLVYPEAKVHAIVAHGAGAPASLAAVLGRNGRVFSVLASLHFDEVYNLNYSGLSFALSRLFPPETVRGYVSDAGQDLKDSWTAMAFRWMRHRRAGSINLADFWANLAPKPLAPQNVNPLAAPKGRGLGIVLAGRNQRRSLPPRVLADVAQTVAASRGLSRLALLGGKGELPMAREVLAALRPGVAAHVENLCGRTDWRDLTEEVSGLDLLLTPDTGTMHLAAHLGTPVLAFFLSSAWCPETGPYGLGHTVWQAVPPCAPCLESAPCGLGLTCLSAFSAPEFLRLLAGKGEGLGLAVTGLRSAFDELGSTWEPFHADLPSASERERFRRFLKRHLGLNADFAADADLAEQFYLERDWIGLERKTCKRNFKAYV
ncbi:glycosyltransferase family 9 protein [Desulfocurvibacter africanus]|uniref:glycosyltransferase family 9 protein n=1 Tax=Desulfocurvibacter africanus TaxID=873 RepID=UPI002FD89B74